MFFADELIKSKTLRNVWCAGNDQDISESRRKPLPGTCQKLDKWIGSENLNPRKRISLRTSAVLIDGAAKIYKHNAARLLQDAQTFNELIVKRRRIMPNVEEINSDSSQCLLESVPAPEIMRRQSKTSSKASDNLNATSPDKNRRTSSFELQIDHSFVEENTESNGNLNKSLTKSNGAIETSYGNVDKTTADKSIILTASRKEFEGASNTRDEKKDADVPNPSRRDQGTQTSSLFEAYLRDFKYRKDDEIDKSLPFGTLLVYDTYNSRVPSGVVFSSLNPKVRDLTYM